MIMLTSEVDLHNALLRSDPDFPLDIIWVSLKFQWIFYLLVFLFDWRSFFGLCSFLGR